MHRSRTWTLLVSLLLTLLETNVAVADDVFQWRQLASVPDRIGFAGAFAGVTNDVLLVAGGANFPERLPWEGGRKQWYDSVFVLDQPEGSWQVAGTLPRPLGYGISISTANGLICIGGGDAHQHYRDVFRLEWTEGRLRTVSLPPLPRPCAFGSGALLGNTVYVAGGLERPDATETMKTFWSLELAHLEDGWREREPWPGRERMLAVPAAGAGSFFLISGTRLDPGPQGKPVREYLTDAYRYTPGEGWRRIADVPRAVVAAASPAPVRGEAQVLVLGGDDGTDVHFQPPEKHPGFSRTVLAYSIDNDSWEPVGTLPFSRATVPLVSWRGLHVVCNGEASPGIRSPEVWAATSPPPGLGIIGYGLVVTALTMLGFGCHLLWQRPAVPILSDAGTTRRNQAWLFVGLLWVVAVFNYVDRQVLFSVFPLLRADLQLTDWQLGLLSTVFLWVYGILSPFSGFLADRYGARRVILGSLLVWSLVTWATGQTQGFGELLGARALMGVSEACYLPAALALIAAVHGNRTRSLATGLHQSGLYVGIVLGGVAGGWLGERYGWRSEGAGEGVSSVVPQFLPSLRELVSLSGFGIMAFAFGSVSVANWVLYTWLPDYLHQSFHMSLEGAGFSATFYLQSASVVGILLGGWLADRWSAATSAGRTRTQGAGLLLAAAALFLAGFASDEILLLGSLILVGLGKGFYECNVMPALCQITQPHLRSTGYGVLNMVGCLTGGTAAALAGAGKTIFGLGAILQLAALLLLVSALAIWRLRLAGGPGEVEEVVSEGMVKQSAELTETQT
jgi:N-acetylneuraminic acid mutarotase/MFS family permease